MSEQKIRMKRVAISEASCPNCCWRDARKNHAKDKKTFPFKCKHCGTVWNERTESQGGAKA